MGELDIADAEYETAKERAEKVETDPRRTEARSAVALGHVALNQGDFETARHRNQQALELSQSRDDEAGEASILGNLGLVAQEQGDFEQAEEYQQQSLKIKREIGDRAGEASSLNNLGLVAHEQGDFEVAQNRLERASELFLEIGAIPRALNSLSNLVETSSKLDDRETGLEACETALQVIKRTDVPTPASRARDFRIQAVRFNDSPDRINELYAFALNSVLEYEGGTARSLFGDVWEHQTELDPGDERFPLVLGAGVGYAAHLELLGDDDDTTADAKMVLSEIEPHEARLSSPPAALYDQLVGDKPTKPPDELRESVTEPDEEDPTEMDIKSLEARAFAHLLELLKKIEDISTPDLYRQTLLQASEGPGAVINGLRAVWERREEHTPDSEGHATVMTAGVALAAYLEVFDVNDPELNITAILNVINSHTDDLSPAAMAVFKQLIGESPEYTPEEIDESTEQAEDLSFEDVERALFSQLLGSLQEE